MRAGKPPFESQLLLPPLRATASIITMLAAFLLVAILAAHLAAGDARPYPPEGKPGPAALAASGNGLAENIVYPYSDPATVGLY